MSATTQQQATDAVHFLAIAASGAAVASHEQLWRWLSGDVQQWLPHEAMLIASGDFRSGPLQFDLVSSLPGLRSGDWSEAALAPLIRYCRDCWVAARQQPCVVEVGACCELVCHSGEVDAAASLSGMKSALVHGIAHSRGQEHVFIAFSGKAKLPTGAGMALKLLLPYIDTALRQMPAAPIRLASCARDDAHRDASGVAALSGRERQIMVWVAMGKTNPEIGMILQISEFTVKNHMKSIFGKLDVTNRAQAVSKLERATTHV